MQSVVIITQTANNVHVPCSYNLQAASQGFADFFFLQLQWWAIVASTDYISNFVPNGCFIIQLSLYITYKMIHR